MNEQKVKYRPNFIIIGSMKSGTTSLHETLITQPAIFMPEWKEPGYFVGPQFGGPTHLPLPAADKLNYDRIFKSAETFQFAGESSTHYSKYPYLLNAAKNIYSELGSGVKIIYLVRDPIKRLISQFYHELEHGEISETNIYKAIELHPQLLHCSQYSRQLKNYERFFDDILVLKFENYIQDPQRSLDKLLRFLDPNLKFIGPIKTGARNTKEQRRQWSAWARKLRFNSTFQLYIEPKLGFGVKKILRQLVTKKPSVIAEPFDEDELANWLDSYLTQEDYDVHINAF